MYRLPLEFWWVVRSWTWHLKLLPEDLLSSSSGVRLYGANPVKGRVKEAAGSLSGNKDLKSEGRTDQDKGTFEKKGAVKDLLG